MYAANAATACHYRLCCFLLLFPLISKNALILSLLAFSFFVSQPGHYFPGQKFVGYSLHANFPFYTERSATKRRIKWSMLSSLSDAYATLGRRINYTHIN